MTGATVLGSIRQKLAAGKGFAKKGSKNGFFHILGGNTLVKVISALSVIFFPRIMGGDYGTFKLADNLFSYLLILNGLGMSNVILRYCAAFDTPEEQRGYFNFALRFGVIADAGLLAVFSGALYLPELFGVQVVRYGAGGILGMMLLMAFLDFVFGAAQSFLRTLRENKKYASVSVLYSALYALIPFVLAFLFGFAGKSMVGAVVGRYLAYAVAIAVIFRMLRPLGPYRAKPARLSRPDRVGAVKYSINSLVASTFSLIMPYNESIVLSVMVTQPLFSDFQVAQLVPASIQFLSSSVIVFVYPYFAKNYRDGRWIYKNTKKIIFGMSAMMGVIAAIGIALSPEIVLIFGSRFKTGDAVRLMRIFFITFAINSAVRMPVGNILAAVGEVRFNVANAIFSSTVHLGICWTLTARFGIGGAAYGLLTGYVISSVAAVIYLKYYCNKLTKRRDYTTLPQSVEDIEADEKELL